MAYRLRNDESIPKGLKRLIIKELHSAVEHLVGSEGSDEAIHEARKSIKKVRAALRLIRKGAPDITNRVDERLRRSGRLLSPLRDADAMLQTAADLCRRDSSTRQEEACAALRRHLATNKARAYQPARLGWTRAQALEALGAVGRSAKYWDLSGVRFPVIARGLKRVYRDARQAMPGVEESHDAVVLHRWRRRVKVLWYNLRLLEERMPLFTRLADDFEGLEAWLGEDHNLVLLREQISHMPTPERSGLAQLTALAGRRQEELRRASRSLGARLFAAKPKDFFKDLDLWRQGRNLVAPARTFKARRTSDGRLRLSRTNAAQNLAPMAG
jgi:CHAD domain-containing protein